MAFYLIKNDGQRTYISNNYLRQKLITMSNSKATEITNNDISLGGDDYLFFARIGYKIPEITMNDAVETLMKMITKNSIDDVSVILTLEKTHILAIVYLLREGIMSEVDFMRFIKMKSTSSRSQMLLEFIAREDEEIDIFAPLLSALQKKSNFTNFGELSSENEIEAAKNKIKRMAIPSYRKDIEYFIWKRYYDEDTLLYRFYNWEYEKPYTIKSVWTYTKVITKVFGIVASLFGGIFGLCLGLTTFHFVETLVASCKQVRQYDETPQNITADTRQILTNYYNSISTELIKDKFSKRFSENAKLDDKYMDDCLIMAFNQVRNNASYDFRKNPNHKFWAFGKLFSAIFNQEDLKDRVMLPLPSYGRLFKFIYDNGEITCDNKIVKDKSLVNNKFEYLNFVGPSISDDDLVKKRYIENKETYSSWKDTNNRTSDPYYYLKYNWSSDENINKKIRSNLVSLWNAFDFENSYYSPSRFFNTYFYYLENKYPSMKGTPEGKLDAVLRNNMLIKEDCDTGRNYEAESHYHSVANLGISKFKQVVSNIIEKYFSEKAKFKVAEIYDKSLRESRLAELEASIPDILNREYTTYEDKMYIPMVYEVLTNYMAFLKHGNSIYLVDSDSGSDDITFDIAVSEDYYNFYRALYFLRHTFLDLPAINDVTKGLRTYNIIMNKLE